MSFRVLVAESLGDAGLALLRAEPGVEVDYAVGIEPDTLRKRLADCDALVIRSGTRVGADELAASDRLRVIVRAGTGIDNVDVDAATARGVAVMNTPGGNTIAAAEHTLALMLALARHVSPAHRSLLDGRWDRQSFVGWELHGKRLGLVGFGRIGREVAVRALAFRMSVVAFDPYISREAVESLGVGFAALDTVLQEADIVSLHLPLTDSTRSQIGAEQLASMKRGAYIVNCARGGLVDEDALLGALDSEHIAGAAVDAFVDEPKPNMRLIAHPHVVATPHLGASTSEAKEAVGLQAARQVLGALNETSFENALNVPIHDAEVLARMRPFLELAERMGAVQVQLAEGGIREIDVEVAGELEDSSPIRLAFLRGLLEPIVGSAVNYVNAAYLAKQRGVRVSETRSPQSPDYPILITTRVRTDDGRERSMSGTVFSQNKPRLVELEGFRTDAIPAGELVICLSRDRPGVIGRIGHCFGQHGANISEFRLGRREPGDDALSVLTVDTSPEPRLLEALRALDDVVSVKRVSLRRA